jgi:flagellar hook-basal body complex protein FliE
LEKKAAVNKARRDKVNISSLNNTLFSLADKISGSKVDNGNGLASNPGEQSFSQIFNDTLEQVNSSQKAADQLTQTFLVGGPVDIQQMLIAAEKADLALRQTVEIRDKLIDAYKQIANMQI